MISIDTIRKIDSLNTANMSDSELLALNSYIYESVNLMFDNWYKQKSSFKNPNGLLLPKEVKDIIYI